MTPSRCTTVISSFLLVFIFLVSGSYPLAAQENDSEENSPSVLSILDFADNSNVPDLAWLSAGLADMLLTDLAPAGITLVNRSDIEEVFEEQSLALMGLTEDDTLVVGRMVLADALLTGSYASINGILRIDARIIDVTTAAVIATTTVSGSEREIFSMEARLAVETCKALGLVPPPGLGEPGTTSLPAARAFYEGLALQSSGEIESARKRFEDSAVLDPLYAKPRYSLEESWQLLKDFRSMRQQRELNTQWKKAEALKSRLAAVPFIDDMAIMMATYTLSSPAEDPTLGSCPSPAICLWNLQITYWEIGTKSAEYFDDNITRDATLWEIVRLSEQAGAAWPEDEWLPEVLYWKCLALRWLGEWDAVKEECERFFLTWPDFRMAWALEDMYEMALEELGE